MFYILFLILYQILDYIFVQPLFGKKEVKEIKKACGSDFLAITPGIRLGTENQHDQKRVMNPAEAFSEGSDYLVIGRSITNSDNPDKIFNKIAQELL